MKKALVVGLLALLSLGVFAQTNPYTTATVDLWKVVQDCRTFFKNTLVTTGITRENLVHLNVFLTSRQMSAIWTGLALAPITTLQALADIKYIGPSTMATILIFFKFSDEATKAPELLGKIKP